MSRTITQFNPVHRNLGSRHALLAVGFLFAASAAVAQSSLPDAQVEANVLKALAGAPQLASESITTRTVYGTVTLSGSVSSEAARTQAENLAANAAGVKKVVDEMQLGTSTTAAAPPQPAAGPGPGQVLLSDGTYGPDPSQPAPGQAPGSAPAETAQRNNPHADQALDAQQAAQQPANNQTAANSAPAAPAAPAPARRPMYAPGYPGYGYPQQQGSYPPAGYAQQQPYNQGQPIAGGQLAGQAVTIPAGVLVRVRINRTLRSDKTQPGTTFDATVVNDVVADGFVAIPRGATVQGKVIDAKNSGALSGRGELALQLTQVTLAGKTYPLNSDLWDHHGGDKTIESINKTAVGGGVGALIGAGAGGGEGAAIGAGVGGLLGLASSAASGHGQVIIPSEAIVSFQTAGPTQVATVSEQEMQRLAYGVPYSAEQPPTRRVYRVYPGYYPPPGYSPYPPQAYPYPY